MFDVNTQRPELRLLLDLAERLLPLPLHLGAWSLNESIARMTDVASIHAMGSGFGPAPAGLNHALQAEVTPLISLVLYLCSQNAEIGDGLVRPANPAPVRTKKGLRFFPPDKPVQWDVGVRLGAALRQAYQAEQTRTAGAPHAGPRPHIRRAHWHGFRSGPLKRKDGSPIQTQERPFSLKWLPPSR